MRTLVHRAFLRMSPLLAASVACSLTPGQVVFIDTAGSILEYGDVDVPSEGITGLVQADGPVAVPGLLADPYLDPEVPDEAALRAQMVTTLQDTFDGLDVSFTLRRPAGRSWTRLVMTDSVERVAPSRVAAGLAVLDCGNLLQDVAVVGAETIAESLLSFEPADRRRSLYSSMAHELGHTFGLSHTVGSGVMSGRSGLEFEVGEMADDGSQFCGASGEEQDAPAILLANLGPAAGRDPPALVDDDRGPELSVVAPSGPEVPVDFTPCVQASDPSGLELVFMQRFAESDATRVHTELRTEPPFTFESLYRRNVEYVYRFVAVDRLGNAAERRVVARMEDWSPTQPDCAEPEAER